MTDRSVIAYSSIWPLARCTIIEFIAVTDFVTMVCEFIAVTDFVTMAYDTLPHDSSYQGEVMQKKTFGFR